jgi:hypothetical protein
MHVDLANEFAAVSLELDHAANGVRLKITDLQSGRVIYLDPFELASLTAATPDDFDRLARPA